MTVSTNDFAAVLDRSSASDAVLWLALGSVGFGNTAASGSHVDCRCWEWLADLLDSSWGLTGHLMGSVVDRVDALDVLGYCAELCRRTGAGVVQPDAFWVEARESAHEAAAASLAHDQWPAYWAFSAAEDVALDSLDHRQALSTCEAVISAFTALIGTAATQGEAKEWMRTALTELERRVSPPVLVLAGGR